jgi:transglutaminase superfamily protein
VSRFTDLALEPAPSLEALLLSLAAEFRPIDEAGTNRTLTRLATALTSTDRIASIGDILGVVIGFRPTRTPGPDALHIDTALRDKAGEPAMLAAIYAIAASRAGIPLTVAGALTDGWSPTIRSCSTRPRAEWRSLTTSSRLKLTPSPRTGSPEPYSRNSSMRTQSRETSAELRTRQSSASTCVPRSGCLRRTQRPPAAAKPDAPSAPISRSLRRIRAVEGRNSTNPR